MRFSVFRKTWKTNGKTMFCAIRKTRSGNLIKPDVYLYFWSDFLQNGSQNHQNTIRFIDNLGCDFAKSQIIINPEENMCFRNTQNTLTEPL